MGPLSRHDHRRHRRTGLAEDDPSWSLAPSTPTTIRRLADLEITTLAQMHGPAYTGDCRAALTDFAAGFERILARTATTSTVG